MKIRYIIWMFFFAISTLQAAENTAPPFNWNDLEQDGFIGEGSFGKVYRGRLIGQTEVAIKVLYASTLSQASKREFDQEVKMLWQCHFPRVVRLYGICTTPGHNAMIFELMDCSLYDLVHSDQVISEKQKWQIAIDIAEGLTYLHDKKGIVHRDLKSHNILLDKEWRAKIADFGLAKLRLTTSTFTHHVTPTTRWCAPEVLDYDPSNPLEPNPAMDMYSYGMILWELVARKIPFESESRDQIVSIAIIRGKHEKIPENCSEVWKKIIEECWQKEPERRPIAKGVLDLLIKSNFPSSDSYRLDFITLPLSPVIPDIAKGYEEIYLRFIKGKLIYKPDPKSDKGRVDLPIAALVNPLEDTFDLSQCGDMGKYLSIATGYRKGKNPENADKVEIWLTPRFFAERVLNNTPSNHYLRSITTGEKWNAAKAQVGLFWTWGDWDDLSWCDYLTTNSLNDLGSENLYEKWTGATRASSFTRSVTRGQLARIARFFHVN